VKEHQNGERVKEEVRPLKKDRSDGGLKMTIMERN
jgi:hypothetical protein